MLLIWAALQLEREVEVSDSYPDQRVVRGRPLRCQCRVALANGGDARVKSMALS